MVKWVKFLVQHAAVGTYHCLHYASHPNGSGGQVTAIHCGCDPQNFAQFFRFLWQLLSSQKVGQVGQKTCMWDASSNAINWFFYLHWTFLSSSSALKLQLLYGDWYFHATSLFFEEFITAMYVFQKRSFLAYLLNAQHGETLQAEAAVGNSSWLLILCPFFSLGKSRILCGHHWPTQLVCSTQPNDLLVAISPLFNCSARCTLWQILSL